MAYKLVVTTDLSEFSDHVIEFAIPTAKVTGAEVHLLHVIRPAHETARAESGFDPVSETQAATLMGHAPPAARVRHVETATQASERMEFEARDALNKLVRRFPEGVAHPIVRAGGRASRHIVEYADEVGADMIIMATHGRSAVAHVVLGSVAAAVVRSSPVPVLLKRPTALGPHPEDVAPETIPTVSQ